MKWSISAKGPHDSSCPGPAIPLTLQSEPCRLEDGVIVVPHSEVSCSLGMLAQHGALRKVSGSFLLMQGGVVRSEQLL